MGSSYISTAHSPLPRRAIVSQLRLGYIGILLILIVIEFNLCTFSEAPQVQAISNYTAQMPDELSLDVGDVVSVYRKMPDGIHSTIYYNYLFSQMIETRSIHIRI